MVPNKRYYFCGRLRLTREVHTRADQLQAIVEKLQEAHDELVVEINVDNENDFLIPTFRQVWRRAAIKVGEARDQAAREDMDAQRLADELANTDAAVRMSPEQIQAAMEEYRRAAIDMGANGDGEFDVEALEHIFNDQDTNDQMTAAEVNANVREIEAASVAARAPVLQVYPNAANPGASRVEYRNRIQARNMRDHPGQSMQTEELVPQECPVCQEDFCYSHKGCFTFSCDNVDTTGSHSIHRTCLMRQLTSAARNRNLCWCRSPYPADIRGTVADITRL